jgi:hypothetical protein
LILAVGIIVDDCDAKANEVPFGFGRTDVTESVD